MGLAAPKKRTLVSADPRNNNWANNTETFGQKLLRAHGWTPGAVLGAKDASHAEHFTEASSTHIKVTLRDDNMGIGAKKNNGDTCTGLNDFQDLLGRLNGKTETVIEAEREVRQNMKRNLYIERKFGVMRFVPGGWLVGDRETKAMEALIKDREVDVSSESDADSDSDSGSSDSEAEEPEQPVRETKKRKADDAAEAKDSEKKKSKKRKSGDEAGEETEKQKRKRERRERRERKEMKRKARGGEDGDAKKKKRSKSKSESEDSKMSDEGATTDSTSKKSKKEKRKKEKESKENGESDTEQKRSKKKRRKESGESTPVSVVVQETTSITSTPAGSGTSTPTTRFTSRSRFIAQKRAAFADPKALAQILMIKPPS